MTALKEERQFRAASEAELSKAQHEVSDLSEQVCLTLPFVVCVYSHAPVHATLLLSLSSCLDFR